MWYAILAAAPVLMLAVPGLTPSRVADRRTPGFRRCVQLAAGASLAAAVGSAIGCAVFGPQNWSLIEVASPVQFRVSMAVDALSCVMQCLIGFLGLVIVQYSMQTLDGEAVTVHTPVGSPAEIWSSRMRKNRRHLGHVTGDF